jgi:hypothetical protein
MSASDNPKGKVKNSDDRSEDQRINDENRPRSASAVAAQGNGDYRKEDSGSLIDTNRAGDYRERWTAIQAVFVDEPRDAVKQADNLVKELMRNLAQTFDQQRTNLEQQWSSGEQVSTEQLRVSLQRYRMFFEHLLST